MTKITTDQPEKFYFTYPNTVAVICVKEGGQVYLMSAVWQIPLSHSPMLFGVLVSPKRHTYQKLLTAKDFTLNYMAYEQAQFVTNVGSSTGASIDKSTEFDVALEASKSIESPVLKDAYVSIECKARDRHTFGDHDLFTAAVSQVWYDDEVIDGGILKLDAVNPLLYTGNMTYTTINHQQVRKCDRYQS